MDTTDQIDSAYVDRFFDALASGDVQTIVDMCAPDVIYAAACFPGPPVIGHEGVRLVMALMGQQLKKSEIDIVSLEITDGCALVDARRHYHYNDDTRLECFLRCRIEVNDGLIQRFECTPLDLPQLGGNPGPVTASRRSEDGTGMPRSIIRVHVGREQLWLRQEEVRYLQAAGKNTLVFTRGTQGVVRSGLSATASLLNRRDFWQIHRGNVININLVRASYRDDLGRLVLTLSDGPEKFIVSRSHEHLFVRARH